MREAFQKTLKWGFIYVFLSAILIRAIPFLGGILSLLALVAVWLWIAHRFVYLSHDELVAKGYPMGTVVGRTALLGAATGAWAGFLFAGVAYLLLNALAGWETVFLAFFKGWVILSFGMSMLGLIVLPIAGAILCGSAGWIFAQMDLERSYTHYSGLQNISPPANNPRNENNNG